MGGQLTLEIPKKIFVHRTPVNMSNGFRGLSEIVREEHRKNPRGGDLFVFLNKKRTYIKVLTYASGGWVLLAKKLENGTFSTIVTKKSLLGERELQMVVDATIQEILK